MVVVPRPATQTRSDIFFVSTSLNSPSSENAEKTPSSSSAASHPGFDLAPDLGHSVLLS